MLDGSLGSTEITTRAIQSEVGSPGRTQDFTPFSPPLLEQANTAITPPPEHSEPQVVGAVPPPQSEEELKQFLVALQKQGGLPEQLGDAGIVIPDVLKARTSKVERISDWKTLWQEKIKPWFRKYFSVFFKSA